MVPVTRALRARWTPLRQGVHRPAAPSAPELDYDVPFIPVARELSPIRVGMRGP